MLAFGLTGAVLIFLGFLVGLYEVYERYVLGHGNRAFLYLMLFLVLAGIALFGFGFVGDLVAGVREEVRGLRSEVERVKQRHRDGV